MLSIKHKFLFVHVPKTAGNSIQNILSEHSEDKLAILSKHQDGVERFGVINEQYATTKHSTLQEYQQLIDPSIFNQLFKFSIIRNPWDRLISFYFSRHRGTSIEWNRHQFATLIKTTPSIDHHIKTPTSELDFLIRFESLNHDFKKACAQINIPFTRLPHLNKSTKEHYSKYYDSELIELVKTKFISDISLGCYYFEKN